MDRVLSARVSEAVLNRIGSLARRRGTTRKRIIEEAIEMYAEAMDRDLGRDVFEETCGAWSRTESPADSVREARRAFRDSMTRHRR